MIGRMKKHPPAFKHGAYAATRLLPGENPAEFEKLHRGLIAEFEPEGPLEHDTVLGLARYVWRKQNFTALRVADRAQQHCITNAS